MIPIELLQARANLLTETRRFFDARGFCEVQTPVLSHDTMVDRYIEPVPVSLELAGVTHRTYLQTSPEFCLKRLLCRGARAIYQLGPAFRGGECGPQHNPEFTMLEWYRVGDDYAAGRQLLDEFSQAILRAPPARQRTFADAFGAHAGVDPWSADLATLHAQLPPSAANSTAIDRDNLWNLLWSTRVEPQLGIDRPEIVYDWPASQAALAQIRPGSPPVAERFELYAQSIELANGYHELTNPDEQRQRLEATNRRRIAEGKSPLPTTSRLLADMQEFGLPACCGVAVGFDRLLMVRTGAKSIREVLAFPFELA